MGNVCYCQIKSKQVNYYYDYLSFLFRFLLQFQWDRAHFESVTKRLDDILGPKQPQGPKMSWANLVNNRSRPPAPQQPAQPAPSDPKKVDEGWIPKTKPAKAATTTAKG